MSKKFILKKKSNREIYQLKPQLYRSDIHSNVAVAGQDKKFHWAKVILNGVLTAHSDAVKNPIAIRYAWSDNPGTTLIYNEFNLPISPFRSDDW